MCPYCEISKARHGKSRNERAREGGGGKHRVVSRRRDRSESVERVGVENRVGERGLQRRCLSREEGCETDGKVSFESRGRGRRGAGDSLVWTMMSQTE